MTGTLDLRLPEPERRRAAALCGGWTDLLYVPGAGFGSMLDPGMYRSTFFVVPAEGRPVRVSSFVVPAFGGELCRLRLEPLTSYRPENLGSFFDPQRRGIIYAMAPDRRSGVVRPPDRPDWSYAGPSLADALGTVTRVRVLRERGRGGDGASWTADRALVLTGADGRDRLVLSVAAESEQALLVTSSAMYRGLLDPSAPPIPGATVRDLLGYGDWDDPLELDVTLEDLP